MILSIGWRVVMRFLRNNLVKIYNIKDSTEKTKVLLDELNDYGIGYELLNVSQPLPGQVYPMVFINGRKYPYEKCLFTIRLLNDTFRKMQKNG